MEQSPKEKLIETATVLFSEYGFHATGINRILEESGIAKKTLYHHFSSKDELIVEVLQRYDRLARQKFKTMVEERAAFPLERIFAFFDVLEDWYEDKNFFGCFFTNAVGEYSAVESEIRAACQNYKKEMRYYLRELCFLAGLPDPEKLGDQLFMLFEGATVIAQVAGDSKSAILAKQTATQLIEQAQQS
ncbi:TetR/AcrR family transcriptional regulator [Kordiimonas sp. SCSIO 12603]|uniref:TetR/AcrR family transcriptional regulator n=1 Tax=Kordiimonas sp. SCSIO 12603 TaxID=2829596 RepID=UPI00210723B8|nr:TetR/AcrR family transcriptional regulator [Kordiimonas sp. SCSIO 12603]UTW57802.1 TetR/AcrR family transcriptional regulator [Kordiimonas sp. SCSIO 12603]